MLHASRPAALTGSTMSAATRRMPTTRIDSATVTAVSAASATFRLPIGHARDACSLFVDHDCGERAVEERDGREPEPAEQRDRHEIAARDGEDRAEEVLEEVDVQRTGLGDEDDAERDPRIEDERERLVACGASARAEELDRDASQDREDERGQHRRDVEQDPRRHSREGDVADAVAEQRLPSLHEEEARRQARARRRSRRRRAPGA